MNIKKILLTRKTDPRGWLVENESTVVQKSMKHFLFSCTKKGGVRGQHYHKRKREWFLVVQGQARIVFQKVGGAESGEIVVSAKKPVLIEAPPMIAHAIENIGKDDLCLIAVVSEPLVRDDPDTFPYKVI